MVCGPSETTRRLCSNLLPIHMSSHKIWLLHVRVAGIAVAVRNSEVPDVSTVVAAVVVREGGVVGGYPSRNVCSMNLLLLKFSRVLVEQSPVVVSQVSTRGAQVIRRVEARVRSRRRREERRGIRGGPCGLWVLLGHVTRSALTSRRLGVSTERLLVWAHPLDVGVDGRKGGQAVESGCALEILLLEPVAPVLEPRVVVLALIEVDVQVPGDGLQPLVLKRIQLRDRDATHFRPRAVLEGVVIKELAAQEQADSQHPPHLAIRGLEAARCTEHVDASREIVHAEEDSGGGQAGRGEKARYELAEGGRDGGAWDDESLGHLGDIVGHLIYLVVQHSADAAGKHDGQDVGGGQRRLGKSVCVRTSER